MLQRRVSLPVIITMARAGSFELAERLFREGGYAERVGDAASLAVLGRLLKDRAGRLPHPQRAEAYARAAEAYAAADRAQPQPYTRLNVAALSFLAGDRDRACAIARDILDWLDSGEQLAETPYYLEAARAEALLLCGEVDAAAAALANAIAAQPEAWLDHAATIAQLRTICAAAGLDATFIDPLRPPRSLHYAGHLGLAPEGHELLSAGVRRVIEAERIGFGFGALAAGCEIVIAEALVEEGAELHVFLPGQVEEFAAISVDPYGEQWRTRFDRCLEAAVELRCFPQPRGRYQPLGSRIAADVAMGAALMNAAQLESDGVQLLVADEGEGEYGSGSETARIGRLWHAKGAIQHVLRAPRTAPVAASGSKREPEGDPDLRLAALIRIELEGLDALDEADFARAVHEQMVPLRRAYAELPLQPDLILPAGNARILGFSDPASAWRYARAMLALPSGALPLKLSGHYGLAHWLGEPAALVGRALADLERIAQGAVPGVLTVSEPLARVLQLADDAPHVEHVGEAGEIELYAVTEEVEGLGSA
jgi:hypothetical protein